MLATMEKHNLAAFVRSRRDERGMSQKAVAAEAAIPQAALSDIERGKIKLPNADIRRRLARALGVSHLDLLVAAGEITPDEIPRGEPVVERDPLASELIALIRGINWEPDEAAFAEQVLRQMFEKGRR